MQQTCLTSFWQPAKFCTEGRPAAEMIQIYILYSKELYNVSGSIIFLRVCFSSASADMSLTWWSAAWLEGEPSNVSTVKDHSETCRDAVSLQRAERICEVLTPLTTCGHLCPYLKQEVEFLLMVADEIRFTTMQ